ncbi:transposase [Shimazuella alba]|uniref:Uncharacterized protein n=1 Tax=Shimazuella alba TaxID=2690964 RepID=A0A6I4VQ94_9BACL|nr:transposase [Shimazuella alba]MXQ52445.1 hypothetical protein [Shimazuella alba]
MGKNESDPTRSNPIKGIQLVITATILWNIVYIAQAVGTLQAQEMNIPKEYSRHPKFVMENLF